MVRMTNGENHSELQTGPKKFLEIREQIELLASRGMEFSDVEQASSLLERVSYYRLSGYWYSFRQFASDSNSGPSRAPSRTDEFLTGTTFESVVELYEFDRRLRDAILADVSPIEVALRASIGHSLGRLDPLAHLKPEKLGPTARAPKSTTEPSGKYTQWRSRYSHTLRDSREDFVAHHAAKYGGQLPVWAAVEILDWGSLSYLYSFAPPEAVTPIATRADLSTAQLTSWIKTLNVTRNHAAHNSRMFNKVFSIKPKLPGGDGKFDILGASANRVFTQLSLIQAMTSSLLGGHAHNVRAALQSFPHNEVVPISSTGAPEGWEDSLLWAQHALPTSRKLGDS